MAHGLPSVSLVDTRRFMLAPDLEEEEIVRHVSRMSIAAAHSRMPPFAAVLRCCARLIAWVRPCWAADFMRSFQQWHSRLAIFVLWAWQAQCAWVVAKICRRSRSCLNSILYQRLLVHLHTAGNAINAVTLRKPPRSVTLSTRTPGYWAFCRAPFPEPGSDISKRHD